MDDTNSHPNPGPYYRHPRRIPPRRQSLAASCALAVSVAVILLLVPGLVLFLLFRPRDPTLSVTSVRLNSTAFVQSSSVLNPNRAAFSHYGSTVALLRRGSLLGFGYIPAGEIRGGGTQRVEASLAVAGFRPALVGPNAQVESRVRLKGRVRVLRFFMHRVEVTAACRIDVASGGGAVVAVRC